MVVQRAIDIDENRIVGRALRGDLQRYDAQ